MNPRQAEIDRILYEEWDPIRIRDVAPRDEYRSYVVLFERLLGARAGTEEIAAVLRQIRTERMGLRANDERDRAIAEGLRAR